MVQDPFDTYGQGFNTSNTLPTDVFGAVGATSQADQQKRKEQSSLLPYAVSLPPHLFIPATAQSVDLRQLANVPPATTVDLIRFTAPQGVKTKFIGYAVFSDALMFTLIEFVPKVNNKRIFPFHGDPQNNFKIGLGLASDFSNAALVACQLDMNPGETLVWTFTNNDVVDVAAGIRMSGYIDSTIQRNIGRFGG